MKGFVTDYYPLSNQRILFHILPSGVVAIPIDFP